MTSHPYGVGGQDFCDDISRVNKNVAMVGGVSINVLNNYSINYGRTLMQINKNFI